jgi:hypothetical protein
VRGRAGSTALNRGGNVLEDHNGDDGYLYDTGDCLLVACIVVCESLGTSDDQVECSQLLDLHGDRVDRTVCAQRRGGIAVIMFLLQTRPVNGAPIAMQQHQSQLR